MRPESRKSQRSLFRASITKPLLPSLPIVKDFDVRRDLPYSFLPGFVTAMMNEFVFQHTPKTLNGRVVIAVPTAAHRCPHFELVKEFSVARGTVLTATVGMMNQTSRCHRPCFRALSPRRVFRGVPAAACAAERTRSSSQMAHAPSRDQGGRGAPFHFHFHFHFHSHCHCHFEQSQTFPCSIRQTTESRSS